jgi:hypothetical protein
MGDMVFKKQYGKLYATVKRGERTSEPSAAQIAHHDRFKAAARYGKRALANPETRLVYEQAAKERNKPVFSVTMADFFTAPTIHNIDLSAYNGQVGDAVMIEATDDFSVQTVTVTVVNATTNEEIEHGRALEADGSESGLWHYTAKSVVPSGTEVKINVVAADRPGGTAVETQTKTL